MNRCDTSPCVCMNGRSPAQGRLGLVDQGVLRIVLFCVGAYGFFSGSCESLSDVKNGVVMPFRAKT